MCLESEMVNQFVKFDILAPVLVVDAPMYFIKLHNWNPFVFIDIRVFDCLLLLVYTTWSIKAESPSSSNLDQKNIVSCSLFYLTASQVDAAGEVDNVYC